MEEGENGPVTPDSPELNTQDTRVNGGSSVQLKDGKAAGAGAGDRDGQPEQPQPQRQPQAGQYLSPGP